MDRERSAPRDEFQSFVASINAKTIDYFMAGCDSGARNTLWGSKEINKSGTLWLYYKQQSRF